MPYTLSTDYPALYSMLLAGEEVACWVDTGWKDFEGNKLRRIASAIFDNSLNEINIRHIIETVVCRNTLAAFTAECTRLNLQYIPQIDVKQVAGDGFSAAIQWAYENQPYLENCWAEHAKEQYLNTLL